MTQRILDLPNSSPPETTLSVLQHAEKAFDRSTDQLTQLLKEGKERPSGEVLTKVLNAIECQIHLGENAYPSDAEVITAYRLNREAIQAIFDSRDLPLIKS